MADDAIYFSAHEVHRGKAAVLDRWRQFFEGPQAPFFLGAEAPTGNPAA